MTLRKLMEQSGVHEKRIRNLKRLREFRTIENCEFSVRKEITKEDLLKYFDSDQFTNDILSVTTGIRVAIERYPNYSLKPINFRLFFSEINPLTLNAHPLVF